MPMENESESESKAMTQQLLSSISLRWKKRLNDLGAQLCLRFRFWLTVTYHKETYKSN